MKTVNYKNTLNKFKNIKKTSHLQIKALLNWPVYNTQTKYFTVEAECIKSNITSKWKAKIAHRQILITINNGSPIIIKYSNNTM
jgi:hypothetical protein